MALISRIERIKAGELASGSAAHLREQMVDIVQDIFVGPDRDMIVQRVLCRKPQSDLALFYDSSGTLLGFSTYAITRHEVEGRRYSVLDGGIYLLGSARGAGLLGSLHILLGSIAFKLRHPRDRMVLVGVATNPASYRLVAHHFAVFHPRRDTEIPAHVSALVRDVQVQKGYLLVGDDPWLVHVGIPVEFRQESRMRRFIAQSRDPDVDFFVQRNPGLFDGQWLSVYMPLDPYNLSTGVRSPRRSAWGCS